MLKMAYKNYFVLCKYSMVRMGSWIILCKIYYVGVTHLTNTTYKSDLIIVIWDPASIYYCEEVLYYQVRISSDEHDDIPNDVVNVACLTTTFLDLRRNTTYNITVTIVNKTGCASITVKTAPDMITESCSNQKSKVTNTGMLVIFSVFHMQWLCSPCCSLFVKLRNGMNFINTWAHTNLVWHT